MIRLSLLLVLLLFASCGHHKNTGDGDASAESTDSTNAISAFFYKRYSGTLGGRPVIVHLHRYGKDVQGIYSYASVGQDIILHSWNDSTQDNVNFSFTEIAPDNMPVENGESPGWTLHIDGNRATGEWHSADGKTKYPIILTEEYPAGTTQLKAFWVSDSVALNPEDPKSPKATASFGYVLPRGGEGSFLYNALKEQIAAVSGSGGGRVEAIVREGMETYFSDYRSENEGLDLSPSDEFEAFTLSFKDDKEVYVHYNDNDWLVTELFSSAYTGGAHGFYGSSYANIDLAARRVWKLMDIVTDSAALRPLLNDAAIAYFKLKPGQGMDQRLLVDEVPPTGNIYVGAKGLSFVYTPYEIASYADGQITLYLSYKKLFSLLSPAFRQRMKLSDNAGSAMNTAPRSNHLYHASRRHARSASLSHRPIRPARIV